MYAATGAARWKLLETASHIFGYITTVSAMEALDCTKSSIGRGTAATAGDEGVLTPGGDDVLQHVPRCCGEC